LDEGKHDVTGDIMITRKQRSWLRVRMLVVVMAAYTVKVLATAHDASRTRAEREDV